MPKTPEGLFKPWFLTRAGKVKLKEFRAQHPRLKYGRLLKAFRVQFPECFKQSKSYHMSYVCPIGCERHPNGGKQHKVSTGKRILDEAKTVLEIKKGHSATLGRLIPWLFHHKGEPLAKFYGKRGNWKPTRYFLNAWKTACKKAGLVGRLRHDFRRTAVRRFDAIPDHVGMKLSGHKSHTVYLAYKATSESDIFDAAKKLDKVKIKKRQRNGGS